MALEGLAERRTSYASGCISARGRPAPSRPTASCRQRVWLWRRRCVAESASGPPPGVRLQRRGGGEGRAKHALPKLEVPAVLSTLFCTTRTPPPGRQGRPGQAAPGAVRQPASPRTRSHGAVSCAAKAARACGCRAPHRASRQVEASDRTDTRWFADRPGPRPAPAAAVKS